MDADGNAILEDLVVDDGSERDVELMGNDRLTLRFSLPSYVTFSSRCYCYFQGVRYTMYIPAEVKKVNTMCYDYVVTMYTHAYELRLTQMKDLFYSNNQYSGGERVTFPYTAKAAEHVAMVVNCMNKADGTRLWRYVIGTDVLEATREKLIVYDKMKCSDALIAIAEAYETEYEVKDDYDTLTDTTWRTITLHRVESHKGSQSLAMEYGKGKGFKSGVVRRTQVSVPPVDVLYVQGGSHNIDKTGYGNDTLLLPSNRYTVYYGYLNGANQMYIEYKATPTSTSVWYDAEGNRMDYIPAIGGFAIYKINNDRRSIYRVTDAEEGTPYRPTHVEEVYDGSEVYPSRVGVVSHVKVTPRSTEDGEPYNLYDIYDETFGTNSNAPSPDYRDACLVDETMTVIFQDGMLAGREFAIQTSEEGTDVQAVMNWDSTLQEWGIPLCPSEEDSMILPNATFAPAIGDHYAVFHCKLPSSYIRVAEFTLLHQAVDWLFNNAEIEYTADGEVDEKWIMADSARSDRMAIGECISLRDTEMFGLGLQMRITGLRQNVNAPWRYSITMDNRPRTLYDWTRMLEKTVRDANEYKATLSPNEQLMPKYRQYKAKSGGGSGGGGGVVMQVNSDWNATSGVAEILNKPYVGEQIIPLEDNGTTTAGVWLAKSDKVTEYVDGMLVLYRITVKGATTTTLNINSLGAKTISLQGSTNLTTQYGVGNWLLLSYRAESKTFVPVNNYYSDSNSVPGVYCSTTASAAAKVGSLGTSDAQLKAHIDGGPMYLTVCMYYSNTKKSALTLNVDGSGAHPIYINGEPSSATNHTLPAGMYFVYWDGTAYQFRTDGKLTINGVVFGGSYNDLTDKPTMGDAGMVRCIYKNTGSTAQSLVLVNTSQAAKVEYLAVDGEEVPRNEIDAGVSSKTLNPSETVTVDIVFAPVTGRMPWRNGVFPSGVLASVAYITEMVIPSGMAFVDENTFGSALTKVWCIGSVPAHFSAIIGTGITVMVPAAFDGVYRSEYGTGVLITTY